MKRKNTKRKSTMTFHLWRDFVMFAVIIMVVLWLLQVIFLSAFYESMKKNEIEKIGDEMVSLYNRDGDEFYSYLESRSFKSGVFAHVLDEEGSIVKSPQPMEEFQRGPGPHRTRGNPIPKTIAGFDAEMWEKFVKRVDESDDKTTAYVISPYGNNRMMIYGAELNLSDSKKQYLYITSPLQPIDATRTVLQNQLIIVSVLSVLASLALAYFIAKRFSRPIIKASKTAEKLASGRYDVHFEDGSYREISQLADVLNNAAKELAKIDRLRMDLMANVSHDLKTPLTIIKSYAEMIRDISGDNKEKRDAHTKVIIDEAGRLSGLVNDILSLSKLQSGIASPELTEFVISDLVGSIMENFSIYSQKDGYTFELDIDPELKVCGDEGQMMQVIYNLIGNAINYTGDSKKVHVSLKAIDDKVRFEVTDYGDGIEDDELAYVWDRYYRTGRGHTRGVTGTGIGLSIVKHILESHGFAYGVSSKVGEGSRFWFECPVNK